MNKKDSVDLSISSDNATFTLTCVHCNNYAQLKANNPVQHQKTKDREVLRNFANKFKENHNLCYLKPARNLKTEIVNYIN